VNNKSIIVLILACVLQSAKAQAPPASTNDRQLVYKTLYLTNLTQPNDANEVISALRNMMPSSKLYYVPSEGAITIRAYPEDVTLAENILADLDKTKKLYRLTYTVTDSDGGKTVGVQHFTIIVASGSKTDFKQGSRLPVSTGATSSSSESGITYLDIGQEIEASLDSYLEGVRLRTRVVQSSVAEDKSLVGPQTPIIRQTTFEGTSTLVQGKPLVLGTFDVPGSTRHQQIEVVSELIH
jgi:hypothetical protein